jgi:Cu/Zn superoxide dismutase
VARYRKTAIAALAASALLLTPTAAYADHNHRGVSASSERGMSWGYYSGDLKDYDPNNVMKEYPDVQHDIFKGAKASAAMIGLDGRSLFRLRVSGIKAEDGVYGVHLHQGECDVKSFDAAEGHYNVAWNPLADLRDREVWLDLKVDSDGDARSTATVDFIPKGDRSIVLHAVTTDPETGKAGPRLACLPFKIK